MIDVDNSKLLLKTLVKGATIVASTLAGVYIMKQYNQSEREKDNVVKQLVKAIEKQNQLNHSSQKEIELEDMLEEQILKKQSQRLNKDNLEPEFVLEKQISKKNQLVYKICITGGPCAGKTSGLALLSEKLRDEGFNVFTVPEAATMISDGGGMIDMSHYDENQQIHFQKALMRSQVQLEDSFMGIAKLSSNKSVVLCDRGLMDGSAYLPAALWNRMLEQMGVQEVQIRDKRYDCVIHLVTAADGAEQYYNKDNDARHESPLEAIMVDRKLQMAWLGHPNYQIVDNNSVNNFDDKLIKLVNRVRQVVGLRGFLSKVHKRFLLENQNYFQEPGCEMKTQRFLIEDVFIQHNQLMENEEHKIYTKIRRRSQDSQQVYLWSQTEYKNNKQTSTQKKQLTFKEYLFLLSLKDPTRQTLFKERICFMWEGIYFVLDTYLNVKEGFSLLKSKLQEGQQITTPSFLHVKREVTGEKGYSSRVLAKNNWYIPEGDEEILNIRKDSM